MPARTVWAYLGDHRHHPFIQLMCRELAARGDDLLVLDESSSSAGEVGHEHHSWALSWGGWISAKLPHTLKRSTRHLLFAVWVTTRAVRHRPDTMVCTMPTSLLAGALVRLLLGARLVYYPFELFGEQVGEASPVLRRLEKVLLRYAVDAVITQNAERAAVYRNERWSRAAPHVVHNFKPAVRHRPRGGELRTALRLGSNTKVVLYEGALVQGRWLDRVLECSPHLVQDAHLVFLGPPTSWWDSTYGSFKLKNPNSRVSYLPGVQHSDIADYVVDADVGIIIYDNSVRNHILCEPGKLSDYVSMSVPVVAPDFPTVGQLVNNYEIGVVFSDSSPRGIAEAINHVIEAPESRWSRRLADAARVMTWETQRAVFIDALYGETVLAKEPNPPSR